MKIKIALVLLLTSNTLLLKGQKNLDISGLYQHRSESAGDGGGGSSGIYIMKDKTFFIVAYATLVSGSWEIDPNNLITLLPKNPEHPFVLFGRHNPNIQQGFKIMFADFEEGPIAIHINPSDTIQRVFNQDANCFKYPYVHEFKIPINNITLGEIFSESDDQSVQTNAYTYQPNGYNDFIAQYIKPEQFYKPIYLTITKGGLQLVNKQQVMPRTNIEPEELNELKRMSKEIIYSDTVIYSNPSYNFGTEVNLANYQFNQNRNAYTHKINYIADEELKKQTDAYNNRNILYKYDKIQVNQIEKKTMTITKKSLFEVKCK